jgi:hypothetical protein
MLIAFYHCTEAPEELIAQFPASILLFVVISKK